MTFDQQEFEIRCEWCENDVSLAAQHNISQGAPVLFGYAYTYDETIYSH